MKLLIAILLFPSIVLKAQEAQLEKYCDNLMPNNGRAGMPACYLLIAKDGVPLVRKAYGMASIELDVPAKPEHQFMLAWVNKQMIAVAILQLVQQGKLRLDDDIRKHLMGINTHGKKIIIVQLRNVGGVHLIQNKVVLDSMVGSYRTIEIMQFLADAQNLKRSLREKYIHC